MPPTAAARKRATQDANGSTFIRGVVAGTLFSLLIIAGGYVLSNVSFSPTNGPSPLCAFFPPSPLHTLPSLASVQNRNRRCRKNLYLKECCRCPSCSRPPTPR